MEGRLCFNINDPAIGWFKIVGIPTYDLDGVTDGIDEYMYISSAMVRQLFNNPPLCRYPLPRKFMFDNRSEF